MSCNYWPADLAYFSTLLGYALRKGDHEEFLAAYDSITVNLLPEQLELVKEKAREIADLPDDKLPYNAAIQDVNMKTSRTSPLKNNASNTLGEDSVMEELILQVDDMHGDGNADVSNKHKGTPDCPLDELLNDRGCFDYYPQTKSVSDLLKSKLGSPFDEEYSCYTSSSDQASPRPSNVGAPWDEVYSASSSFNSSHSQCSDEYSNAKSAPSAASTVKSFALQLTAAHQVAASNGSTLNSSCGTFTCDDSIVSSSHGNGHCIRGTSGDFGTCKYRANGLEKVKAEVDKFVKFPLGNSYGSMASSENIEYFGVASSSKAKVPVTRTDNLSQPLSKKNLPGKRLATACSPPRHQPEAEGVCSRYDENGNPVYMESHQSKTPISQTHSESMRMGNQPMESQGSKSRSKKNKNKKEPVLYAQNVHGYVGDRPIEDLLGYLNGSTKNLQDVSPKQSPVNAENKRSKKERKVKEKRKKVLVPVISPVVNEAVFHHPLQTASDQMTEACHGFGTDQSSNGGGSSGASCDACTSECVSDHSEEEACVENVKLVQEPCEPVEDRAKPATKGEAKLCEKEDSRLDMEPFALSLHKPVNEHVNVSTPVTTCKTFLVDLVAQVSVPPFDKVSLKSDNCIGSVVKPVGSLKNQPGSEAACMDGTFLLVAKKKKAAAREFSSSIVRSDHVQQPIMARTYHRTPVTFHAPISPLTLGLPTHRSSGPQYKSATMTASDADVSTSLSLAGFPALSGCGEQARPDGLSSSGGIAGSSSIAGLCHDKVNVEATAKALSAEAIACKLSWAKVAAKPQDESSGTPSSSPASSSQVLEEDPDDQFVDCSSSVHVRDEPVPAFSEIGAALASGAALTSTANFNSVIFYEAAAADNLSCPDIKPRLYAVDSSPCLEVTVPATTAEAVQQDAALVGACAPLILPLESEMLKKELRGVEFCGPTNYVFNNLHNISFGFDGSTDDMLCSSLDQLDGTIPKQATCTHSVQSTASGRNYSQITNCLSTSVVFSKVEMSPFQIEFQAFNLIGVVGFLLNEWDKVTKLKESRPGSVVMYSEL